MNAYELLNTPTAELDDEQIEAIIIDLRQRRLAYVNSNKKDNPKRAKAKTPATKEEKQANTLSLAAELGLDLNL